MKALFYLGPKRMELREFDPGERAERSVRVRILSAGICGTDIKTYLRGHHLFKPPTILGHECVGVVEEKPYDFEKVEVGDYVVIAPYSECGVCEKCLKGIPELCENKTYIPTGCFSQYVDIPMKHALKAIFKVSKPNDSFVLTEPLACVMTAIERMERFGRFEDALIIGGGVMGSLFALCIDEDEREVVISEPHDWRREFLKDLGFRIVHPKDLDENRRYDVVIMASTVDEPFNFLDLVKDGGSLMLFGGYSKDSRFSLNPYHIHYREVNIVGSFGYSMRNFIRALNEIEKNEDKYAILITHSYHIEDHNKAFERVVDRDCMKVVFRMWKDEEEQNP